LANFWRLLEHNHSNRIPYRRLVAMRFLHEGEMAVAEGEDGDGFLRNAAALRVGNRARDAIEAASCKRILASARAWRTGRAGFAALGGRSRGRGLSLQIHERPDFSGLHHKNIWRMARKTLTAPAISGRAFAAVRDCPRVGRLPPRVIRAWNKRAPDGRCARKRAGTSKVTLSQNLFIHDSGKGTQVGRPTPPVTFRSF